MTTAYPKRLIEVDLPIRRISAHARREKSIRHGHISTLHIWWARRPLAACRAVICASLWPDPADPLCPEAFIATAKREMLAWTPIERQSLLSPESRTRFAPARTRPEIFDVPVELRRALLDFIADFANWDNSTKSEYLETSRALTEAAHVSLGGEPGTRPLVVDPFAGGGSIPLEALRVGADAFASDLNPIPVLLNKVVLEYIPKYGQRLADEVRKWGAWIKEQAEKELAEFYPKDPDGATPIAYLWARTIKCEGPSCGAEVPLIRSLWLAKQAKRSIAIQIIPNREEKRVDFQIIVKQRDGWVDQSDTSIQVEKPSFEGLVKRGSATCPCCGYTTPVVRVREQFKGRHGGANDARLFCVVTTKLGSEGRGYRLASKNDKTAFAAAALEMTRKNKSHMGPLSAAPNEVIPMTEIRRISIPIYGMTSWGDIFSARQSLALSTFVRTLVAVREKLGEQDAELSRAVTTVLSLAISRFSDICNALCMWESTKTQVRHMFTRQAIGMLWDYAEPNIFADAAGNFSVTLGTMLEVLERESISLPAGHVQQASATQHPLPEDSANALITDPPYYDAVPYAHLSDFFYVWLRRALAQEHSDLFNAEEVPKASEIVVDRRHELSQSQKGIDFYERELAKAFAEGRRVVRPDGICTIVFASKTTASWEAILKAVVDAGWIITGSWPIDTEMETRVAAQGQARLASSVHLVCRPRENPDGSVRNDEIGDWRDVLQELPKRIHEWMPRLAEEGVVGADAIFACLGPALEIFSRYSRVEKASGDVVTLKEYLEHVWAAVSKEALSVIFQDAETEGFEPDARLTAMWLWTLAGPGDDAAAGGEDEDDDSEEDEAAAKKGKKKGGFGLEYDAARKIAQGLGAHLEDLRSMVEVSGETARLLSVAERMAYLFGKDQAEAVLQPKQKKKGFVQPDLFAELAQEGVSEQVWSEKTVSKIGATTLDRIHQSMILFAASRGEALKRFLVDDGAGKDPKFWRLAQALSALYPPKCEEKRWVDGVLARKKGLGF
jgi:adenine-specific DNA methylase